MAVGGDPDSWSAPADDLARATWGGSTPGSRWYNGRHHVDGPGGRFSLLIAAGGLVLSVLLIVGLVVAASIRAQPGEFADQRGGVVELPGVELDTSPTASWSSTPEPTLSPSVTPAPTTPAPTPTAPPRTTSAPATVAPFPALTIEAESGGGQVSLGGSAWVVRYDQASGGRIVRNVGEWEGWGDPGTIRFNSLSFPTTSAYILTLYVVHPDGERRRTATVTVSGLDPITVTFTASADCCAATAIRITVPAGVHSVTIANPTGHAPSVDKLVVTRAS